MKKTILETDVGQVLQQIKNSKMKINSVNKDVEQPPKSKTDNDGLLKAFENLENTIKDVSQKNEFNDAKCVDIYDELRKYDSHVGTDYGYEVEKNGLKGRLDKLGKVIFEAEYRNIIDLDIGTLVNLNGQWTLHCSNEEIINNVVFFEERGRIGLKKGNLVGVYNLDGEKIIPCEYDKIEQIGCYYILRANNRYSLFDIAERKVIISNYRLIEQINNLIVMQDENSNYSIYKVLCNRDLVEITSQNKEIEYINVFGLGQVADYPGGRAGIVKIVPKSFLILKSKDDNYGVYDLVGKEIVPQEYKVIKWDYAFEVKDNNDKWGVYDFNGNKIVPCKYNKIVSTKPTLAYYNEYGRVNDELCHKFRIFMACTDEYVDIYEVKVRCNRIARYNRNAFKITFCRRGSRGHWMFIGSVNRTITSRIMVKQPISLDMLSKNDLIRGGDFVRNPTDEYIKYCNSDNKVEVKIETNKLKRTLKKEKNLNGLK